jgi:hypothetical protein
MTSESKDSVKKARDFCGKINKNKPAQPPISSLFQDSEKNSATTETNNTSYESPNIQLFGAKRMRAWQYHEVATPTSRKTVCFLPF